MNKQLLFMTGCLLALFTVAFLCCGCGRDSSPRQQYYESAPEPKPFPGERVGQIKDMIDRGYELFRQALSESSQQEKDALADEALEKYYYPARELLERLKAEFPEHISQIDSLHWLLNKRIIDATKIKGTGG